MQRTWAIRIISVVCRFQNADPAVQATSKQSLMTGCASTATLIVLSAISSKKGAAVDHLIWVGNTLLPRGLVFGVGFAIAVALIGAFVILTDQR